ncbi:restriction endonuclease subunit S, partial [Mycobacterium sp. MAC_080597_8934]
MSEDVVAPDGWTIAPLALCVDVLDSRRKPVNAKGRAARPGPIPYYGATGQVGWIDDYLFDEELVLLGEDGAPFLDKSKPIAYVIDGKSWVNNHAHVLRARREVTSNRYIKHYLDSFDFKDRVQGSTRDKLNQGSMNSIPVLLAPRPTQDTLVAAIDAFESKRASASGHLSAAHRANERFRQAVLAAACSGRLTADWRAERDIEDAADMSGGWESLTLGTIASSIRGGSTEVPRNEPTNYPILRSSSVRPFSIDFSDVRYLSAEQSTREANYLQDGDLLITRLSGSLEYVGNCGIVRLADDARIQYPDRLFCCRLSDPREAQFVELVFAGPEIRSQIEAATRSAAGHQRISISDLKGFHFARPPLDEQAEIVRR